MKKLCTRDFFSQFLLIALIAASCERSPDREAMIRNIELLDSEVVELFQQRGRSEQMLVRSEALRDAYLNFANTFQGDSLSAEFLFQAAMIDADIHQNVNSGIVYLERIAEEYPDHPIAPRSLFLVGFAYAEQINDYDKARAAYTAYLERYPEGDMAESVRIELETLGMRPIIYPEN